jgi:hypothetical protein
VPARDVRGCRVGASVMTHVAQHVGAMIAFRLVAAAP